MSERFPINSDYVTSIISVVLGIVLGLAIPTVAGFETKWLLATLLSAVLVITIGISGHVRSILLLLLALSLTVDFNYHITYWPGHLGVPDGLTIETTDIFVLALIVISSADTISTRHRSIRFFPSTTIPAVLILMADVLSLRNSADTTLTLYGLIDHARDFILYLLIANQVRNYKDLRIILVGIQACGVFIGALCIVEATLETNFSASFQVKGPGDEEYVFRAAGLITPTLTGGLLASLVPLIFVQLYVFKGRLARALTLVAFILALLGLLLTLTRGAWLSLGVAVFPLLFLLIRKRLVGMRQIVFGVIVICSMALAAHDKISGRLSEGLDNVTARLGLVGTAMAMAKDKPVNGIGLNTYTIKMEEYKPDHVIHHFRYIVHNKYLLAWAETGIMGLIAFVWLLGVVLVLCYRRANRPGTGEITMISLGLLGALMTAAVHMNLESYEGGKLLLYVWFLIGLSAAVNAIDPHVKVIPSSSTV